ncbi:MAG TPA: hypothetical protein VNU97_09345 [Rhizomicrobium sp.]|jgi:hypothetical protein|nr:hypothetical protein [Rhizomicrobium sp.]
MSENVVNLEDYRAPKQSGPCIVAFVGFDFETPEGRKMRLTRTFKIADGDFVGAIEAVKQNGGVYFPSQDGGKTVWFLPWPCAAVRISAAQ